MKIFGIIVTAILIICLIYSCQSLQVSAQNIASDIESNLELAKEKIKELSVSETDSNSTPTQLSSNLSNLTLSQEQIKEIEVNHELLLIPCSQRITLRNDVGKLCDAIADYLVEKCKMLDNLLPYCLGSTLGQYESLRNLQLSCSKIPPSYKDIGRINNCLTLLQLNSSYTDSRLNCRQ